MSDFAEQVQGEKIARIRTLEAMATNVATLLGNGWRLESVDEWGHYCKLVDDKGHSIHINNGTRKEGRYSISGGYPSDEHGRNLDYVRRAAGHNVELPKITVAWSRNPEAIAKDIIRRFLPDYLALYAKAEEKQRETNAYHNAAQATAKRIQAAAPGSRVYGDGLDRVDLYRNEGGRFEAECFDDRVNLKISSVPTDKAEAIIRLLVAD